VAVAAHRLLETCEKLPRLIKPAPPPFVVCRTHSFFAPIQHARRPATLRFGVCSGGRSAAAVRAAWVVRLVLRDFRLNLGQLQNLVAQRPWVLTFKGIQVDAREGLRPPRSTLRHQGLRRRLGF
jgi:hypothetical protein